MDVDDLLSIPMIAWFNPTWLFVAGLLEGRGIRHEASSTSAELWQEIGRYCAAIPAAALVAACHVFAPVDLTDSNAGKLERMFDIMESDLDRDLERDSYKRGIDILKWIYLLCYIFIFRDLVCQFICHTLNANRVWSVLVTVWKTRLVTIQYQMLFANSLRFYIGWRTWVN